MAIDQTNKAINMASETMNAAVNFMVALEALEALEAERVAAGLTLSTFDTAYAASEDLKHLNGAALDAVLFTSIPAISSFMTTNNHDDNLQAVRP